jgi:hypothetical protein
MSQKVLNYLKKRLPMATESEIANAYTQADQIYEKEDGVLGVTKIDSGFWRGVFLAADNKQARNELLNDFMVEHPECQVFVFERIKYGNKSYYHTIPFLKRLMAL